MPPPTDLWPAGVPHAIGAVIVQTLRDAAALSGAVVLDNPVRASDLSAGQRIVFFEDQGDRPREGFLKRSYEFSVGVINRSKNARQGAHTDYRAAKRALRHDGMPRLTQAGLQLESRALIEGEVRYRIENLDLGGGLVLGLFSIDYRDPFNT